MSEQDDTHDDDACPPRAVRGNSAFTFLNRLHKARREFWALKAPALQVEMQRRPDVRTALILALQKAEDDLREAKEYLCNLG